MKKDSEKRNCQTDDEIRPYEMEGLGSLNGPEWKKGGCFFKR